MPSSYTNVVLQKPNYLATGNWTPQDDRRMISDLWLPGVLNASDFLVSFVSGLQVQAAAGIAYIPGGNVADQGMYRQYTSTTTSISVGAGGANPRLDQIILRVLDADHDTSGSYQGVLEVIPGTPTSGATLTNRSGAANLNTLSNGSKSYLLLSDVLVPAGAGTINAGALGDRRMRAVHESDIALTRVARTSQFSVTATGEGSAQTVVTAADIFADGIAEYTIEFYCPGWSGSVGNISYINLYDNGANVRRLASNANNTRLPIYVKEFYTPSFGAHTLSIRAWTSAGTSELYAGDGTPGNITSTWVRISRRS